MNGIQKFFWICSGSSLAIIKRCPSDTNKYAGIGATIFFTGLLAAISAAYALFTVFANIWTAIIFGLVWGTMIFNLDRYIVSSMIKKDKRWKEFVAAMPRIILAILIAVVISKPLELKIFDTEIGAELILMEQQVYKEQEDLLNQRYQPSKIQLNQDIEQLKNEIIRKTEERDALAIIAQQEADGTGGSQRRNLGPIYRAKKADADRVDAELLSLRQTNETLINQKQNELSMLDTQMVTDVDNMGRERLSGMAARLDALNNLTKKSEAIYWANWFIMFLFIAIETAPIFVKLISDRGPYDDKLESHEKLFEVNNKERINYLDQQLKENVSIFNNHSENNIDSNVNIANDLRGKMMEAETDVATEKINAWKKQNLGVLQNGQTTEEKES